MTLLWKTRRSLCVQWLIKHGLGQSKLLISAGLLERRNLRLMNALITRNILKEMGNMYFEVKKYQYETVFYHIIKTLYGSKPGPDERKLANNLSGFKFDDSGRKTTKVTENALRVSCYRWNRVRTLGKSHPCLNRAWQLKSSFEVYIYWIEQNSRVVLFKAYFIFQVLGWPVK